MLHGNNLVAFVAEGINCNFLDTVFVVVNFHDLILFVKICVKFLVFRIRLNFLFCRFLVRIYFSFNALWFDLSLDSFSFSLCLSACNLGFGGIIFFGDIGRFTFFEAVTFILPQIKLFLERFVLIFRFKVETISLPATIVLLILNLLDCMRSWCLLL